VAQRLGLRWISIVYDAELIKDFIHDSFFESYYPWVSDLTSMFFLQEYFSVRHLKTHNLIPGNSVFICGYSGDFIAGSYITPAMGRNIENKVISELIFNDYFRLIRTGKKDKLSICNLIGKRIPAGRSEAWKVIESWDLKERHSKFIINSAKVFTFFGYEYVFPLWDNRLVDFMLSLPLSLRMNRKLYEHALRDHFFNVNNLNLFNETNPPAGRKRLQRFKERVKPFLPAIIRNRFIDLKSSIYYDEITRILLEDIGNKSIREPLQPNYYNSYITQWYIIKTAERLRIRLTLYIPENQELFCPNCSFPGRVCVHYHSEPDRGPDPSDSQK
jgi:asparagine synthase (glutamine-hydrolysing)